MTIQDHGVRELPIRRDGERLQPRLPLEQLNAEQTLIPFMFPNGVPGYMTTTAEDFRNILGDPRFHAKRFLGEPQPSPVSVEVPDMPGFIPSMNGPEHLAVRRLAAGDFSVKAVRQLAPVIEEVVDKYLDQTEAAGSPVDLFESYNLPIPSEVIARILGVPTDDTPDFQLAARLTIGGLPDELDDPEAPARAVGRLHELLGEVIKAKRQHPDDDLITRLTQATNPELTDEEIWGLCTNLLLAGHETTSTSSAFAIALLLSRPDAREYFVTHPERNDEMIEELVRYIFMLTDSGAGIPRLATEDVDYNGQMINKGEWVMPCVGTANVDPSVCPHGATQLDLERQDILGHHLTFGFGPHTCLGQHLARAELKVIVPKLFERFPNVHLTKPVNELPWLDKGFGYRMAELPVAW
jgi:cytochrome P450